MSGEFAKMFSKMLAGAPAKAAVVAARDTYRTKYDPCIGSRDIVRCRQEHARAASMGWASFMGAGAYDLYYNPSQNIYAVLFYISLALLGLFLLLTVIHFTVTPVFSFSPNDPGFIPIPTASDRQLAFITGPAAYDISSNFTSPLPCAYTIGADVFLTGGFMATEIPRVILYRSKDPVTGTPVEKGLVATYSDSNIVVWLDPIKNDLFVTAALADSTSITSTAVENVPVRKPFRLTVVFTEKFLEIYINGKLEQSMAITSSVKALPDGTQFYSTIQPIMNSVMLGNLSMWPRVLSAKEILIHEGAPIKTDIFFKTT